MALISDSTSLAMLKMADAEEFDTGKPTRMWAIFARPTVDSFGESIPVKSRRTELTCRESDVIAHELVKQSVITRVPDGSKWSIREINPDGNGMAEIVLGA